MIISKIREHFAPTRILPILAQDPTVSVSGKILTAEAVVPAEELESGPRGYRVFVVDFDASTGLLYPAAEIPVEDRPIERLIADPSFHAQNAYAIVMRTLARFEFALGRRISWSFDGHQLHVAPHAFAEANAFYSKRDRGLFFGYFENENNETIFTCLSHDVVAHETTHALLDGLRERYTFPSSPDQAAFHEGFADVVALLSIFSLPDVVEALLDAKLAKSRKDPQFIGTELLTKENLRETALFGLGEEMDPRRAALRRSVAIPPSKNILNEPDYLEPHNRGEVFVAAMMNSFLEIWLARIAQLGDKGDKRLQRSKVAEEGQAAADHLLTMGVRALDYAPVTDLLFGDYLSALLTADLEVQPDDSKYSYREVITRTFATYGIKQPSITSGGVPVWEPPTVKLDYSRSHFESMTSDRDEIFRFVWENRKAFDLCENAYTRVQSVRPCIRLSTDGFLIRETVAEYVQILHLNASELKRFKIGVPKGMPTHTPVTLYGGGALIFDEYGRLKYHVSSNVVSKEHQTSRLEYLWSTGFFESENQGPRSFSEMHRLRLMGGMRIPQGHDHDKFF